MFRNVDRSAKIFQAMKGLYLILDLSTVFFPIVLSFDKRVSYINSWKNVFLASSIVAIPFLIWDIIFTANGFWGFNPDYLIGIEILGLPIEEILFFWVVPFACIFIYECCKFYLHSITWKYFNWFVAVALLVYILVVNFYSVDGWYTMTVEISTLITLALWKWGRKRPLLGIAFVISLIPFLAINGILTGSFLAEPIVWYSESEFSGIRIFTIPMEDVLYSFTLIASTILLKERLAKN